MVRKHVLLCVSCLLLIPLAVGQETLDQAKVAEVGGKVQVIRGGDEAKIEVATVGADLKPGDIVKTGVSSYAKIEMGPGNLVQLEAVSELKIGASPQSPKLNLLGGKLLNRLKSIPEGKKVQIGTPTSIAGIEGTTFAVSVLPDGTTDVDVLAGVVSVQSAGEPNKFTAVSEMRRVRVSKWEDTVFTATGSGVAPDKYKRPKIHEGDKEVFVVRAQGVGKADAAAPAEEKGASAEKAAMDAALQELASRVLRAKIIEEQSVADLAAKNKDIFQKISALVSAAKVIKRKTLADGSAQVDVEVTLSDLNSALGIEKPVFTSTMVQLAPEQYLQIFTPRARLAAEQAAKIVADRNLLEQIQGVLIDSRTSIQDFALQNDQVSSRVQGVIQGATTVSTVHFSDGTVEVTRQVKGADVRVTINSLTQKEILGTNYLGKPVEIDPIGYEALRRIEAR